MSKIILASSSPRRKELLKMIGLKFKIEKSDFVEKINPKIKPRQLVKDLSLGKAKAVALKHKKAIIIAADTIVVLKNEILGKPHTAASAKNMLKKLNNKKHLVITGFTIIDTRNNKTISKAMTTEVYFRKLTNQEIDNYIKTKEPLDKAGAYGIQGLGCLLVEKINGDYFNVVGLPVNAVVESLREVGVSVI